ncbi:MAG: LexA family transcriptional regulator [Gammaproteobacteria bacterium]|nr:LexA family transcriptional regulator [Gammaproteobacteria bacterium]
MPKTGPSKLTAEEKADVARAQAQWRLHKAKTGETQLRLATRLRVSPPFVWQLLKGYRRISEDWMLKLAHAFDVPPSAISPTLARNFNRKVATSRFPNASSGKDSRCRADMMQNSPVTTIRGVIIMNDSASWQWTEMLPAEGAIPWARPRRYALRITGDALQPRYKSGEYLIVSETDPPEPDTDVLLLLRDGTAMIRELASIRDGMIALRAIGTGSRRTIRQADVDFIHRIVGRADHSEFGSRAAA